MKGDWEMSWNYRIIRKTRNVTLRPGVVKCVRYYDIHEVYYNKKDKIDGWTQDPVDGNGAESVHDLRRSLSMMLCDALKHPVLEMVGKKKKRLVERREGREKGDA